jgi:uroporphyrinogen decarboxylase
MTTHERFQRVYEHKTPDRVLITDWYWESTIERWRKEGMPKDVSRGVTMDDYFGLDVVNWIDLNAGPCFERKIIEETATYVIDEDSWGCTKKDFKPQSATIQHIDAKIKSPETWRFYKDRFTPSRDRINWSYLDTVYKSVRAKNGWLSIKPDCGFDQISTRMINSEIVLLAMAEDPEWIKEMCDTTADVALKLMDMVWDAGYTFDEVMLTDDMAYRNGLLFSKTMYHDIIRPYHERLINWAHGHGIKMHLHCCGFIKSLIPELIDVGFDCLNPLEVKAGMDLAEIKALFGDKLVLRGGFDVQHWRQPDVVEEEIKKKLPAAMANGGYIFSSDHSVPDNVSLSDYKRIIEQVKKTGIY